MTERKKSSEYGRIWSSEEYKKQYQREYRKKNKHKYKAYYKAYREQNKDKIKEAHKAYRKRNKEKLNERNRTYRAHKKNAILENLTPSQRLIFDNIKTINHMKNNGKTWDAIASELGMHRDTLMRALRAGVFDYEKKYILKLKELKK